MFSLGHPAFLGIGLLVLLPYLLHRRQAWHYSNTHLLDEAQSIDAAHWAVMATTWLALGLLVVALAKPVKRTEQVKDVLATRDILLTLDLSLSMEGFLSWEGDTMPLTKLELIQDAALEFVNLHPQDRLGLMVFGDDAFGVWPLSVDRTMLRQRLGSLETLLPPALRGTHVAKAVQRSLDHFDEMEESDSKILLILTDGLDSIDPVVQDHLAKRLQQNHIKLYVLGMQLNENTSIVKLVRQLQGGYFNVNNADELAQALKTIDQQERSLITVNRATQNQDLYRYFALPGLGLLLLSAVCRSTWIWEV